DLAREIQHVQRPLDGGADGAHRVALVVDRRGRTGQVIDLVHLQRQRLGDVVAHQLEAVVVQQVLDVDPRPGEEVVQTDHLVSVGQEPFAKVRAKEAGASGDQDASAGHCAINSASASLWKGAVRP